MPCDRIFFVKNIVGFLTVISFFLWIQPLGAFIKPSAEATACGGNRAFHMCSTQFALGPQAGLSKATTQKTFFSSGSTVSVDKTNGSGSGSGSSGSHMTVVSPVQLPNMQIRRTLTTNFALPGQDFFFSPDPVPKF